MAEICKRYDAEFRAGAVRIARETGKPVAQVARDLGINEGTLATWILREKEATRAGLDPDERAELARLRKEIHELRMERDVLKRSVVLWVKEATK
ncbi:transposase [Streptomyces sp. NPDC048506]|uniref:transposase n=1 Tax=Streptomyces sp. NPDC048506 TaxID=3155028 RepID=UPI003435744C